MIRATGLLVLLAMLTLPAMALGSEPSPLSLGSGDIYNKSLAALTILLVLAILLESALAVIFNWRLFLTYFSLKGVRTPIMIVVSWLVVSSFHLDVLAALINAYQSNPTPPPDPVTSDLVTQFLTALIVAGGSSGVYTVMKALGYRQEVPQEAPKPPKEKGWISVRVRRVNARGAVLVKVSKVSPQPAQMPAATAGVVGGERTPILDIFVRNPNRFPQTGGYEVSAGQAYDVTVESSDGSGQPIFKPVTTNPIVLAPGAVVDLDVEI